jgi:DNA polymerase/3'-5' exonuclease PolX
MPEEYEITLNKAQLIANRFLKLIEPCCLQMSIAGSVRRECPVVHDIDFVAVPKDEFCFGRLFIAGYPGLITNGARMKVFKYPESQVKIELFLTTIADYGRILAIRTGSRDYSHIELAMRWNRIGWNGTEDGLRRKRECEHKSVWRLKPEYRANPTLPPIFDCEEKFYEFLGIKWISPKDRNLIIPMSPTYNK